MRLTQRRMNTNITALSRTTTTLVPTKIPMTAGSSVCEMKNRGIPAGNSNNSTLAKSVERESPEDWTVDAV